MDITQITALVLIVGTGLIYIGFGAFPWRIYTEESVQAKLDLLAAQPRLWFLTQTLVLLGSIVSAAGSICLIPLFSESRGDLLSMVGAVGFVLGSIFWIWSVGLRTVKPQMFAKNELPGWLFRIYSILVLLALACFGAAFWLQGIHQALGAGIFLGSLLVLGLFLTLKDMLPAVYYAMTLTIGLTLLF
jgi:hypothetical protein